jgi:hypothetical protein
VARCFRDRSSSMGVAARRRRTGVSRVKIALVLSASVLGLGVIAAPSRSDQPARAAATCSDKPARGAASQGHPRCRWRRNLLRVAALSVP